MMAINLFANTDDLASHSCFASWWPTTKFGCRGYDDGQILRSDEYQVDENC
jgi:hypothetical protein